MPEPPEPPTQYADADADFELAADFELGLTEEAIEQVEQPVGGGKKSGRESAA